MCHFGVELHAKPTHDGGAVLRDSELDVGREGFEQIDAAAAGLVELWAVRGVGNGVGPEASAVVFDRDGYAVCVLCDGDAYLSVGVFVGAVPDGVGDGLAGSEQDVVSIALGHTDRSEHRLDPLVHMRELLERSRNGELVRVGLRQLRITN